MRAHESILKTGDVYQTPTIASGVFFKITSTPSRMSFETGSSTLAARDLRGDKLFLVEVEDCFDLFTSHGHERQTMELRAASQGVFLRQGHDVRPASNEQAVCFISPMRMDRVTGTA